jgi:hypothetical protein
VPLSRAPSISSAVPRLSCALAHSSGTPSRVHSVSAARKAVTASSNRAVPLSRSPSPKSALPRLFCVRGPVERHTFAGSFLQGVAIGADGFLQAGGAALNDSSERRERIAVDMMDNQARCPHTQSDNNRSSQPTLQLG